MLCMNAGHSVAIATASSYIHEDQLEESPVWFAAGSKKFVLMCSWVHTLRSIILGCRKSHAIFMSGR